MAKKSGGVYIVRSGTPAYPLERSSTGSFKKSDFDRALRKVASAKPKPSPRAKP